MKTINKTLLATAVGMAMVSTNSHAEIELGKGLSVTGFVDMSFVYQDDDSEDETTQVFAVDQVEVDFLYSGANGVSAQVDIEYGESADGKPQDIELDANGDEVELYQKDETFVEQAFIKKQINDQLSVKAGRFLSYTGWETEEPTGLYQYSGTGYAEHFYGGYQQGVSGYYDAGVVDVMVSLVNDAFDAVENDNENIAVELGVAIEPVEGLTAKLFYIDNQEDELINLWASYSVDSLTFAAEYNTAEYGDDTEGDGYLVMANFATGDFGFTVRYHDFEIEDANGNTTVENDAITLAPSYACSDNLLIVAEYRMDSYGDDNDVDTFAVEALYTF